MSIDKEWIQARLKALGKSQRGLAKHLGLDPARITDMLKAARKISFEEALELAEFLELDLETLAPRLGRALAVPGQRRAAVVGYVGAGDAIYPLDDHAPGAGIEEIDAPPGEVAGFCVRVRGNSMAPRFRDGEYLGYSREEGLDLANCYGRECLVHTEDGRKLVKIVERGSREGRLTLISVNAAYPIETDVTVRWAAPITWVKLRKSR
jgi:phage repressor protein C with HTH and peptisase S24 domain